MAIRQRNRQSGHQDVKVLTLANKRAETLFVDLRGKQCFAMISVLMTSFVEKEMGMMLAGE